MSTRKLGPVFGPDGGGDKKIGAGVVRGPA